MRRKDYWNMDKSEQLKFLIWAEDFQGTLQTFTERELEDLFDDFLDDCHETVKICGYEYSPSEALYSVDPTAYRQEFLFFVDTDYVEIDDNYMSKEDYESLISDYYDHLESLQEEAN